MQETAKKSNGNGGVGRGDGGVGVCGAVTAHPTVWVATIYQNESETGPKGYNSIGRGADMVNTTDWRKSKPKRGGQ